MFEGPPERTEESRRGLLRRLVGGLNIGHLLLLIFALHLFALSFPSDTSNGGGLVFDESFYVPAAHDLLKGSRQTSSILSSGSSGESLG
jgi:hypothetical protein